MTETPKKIRLLLPLICMVGFFVSLPKSYAAVWLNENFNSYTNGQIPTAAGQILSVNGATGAVIAVTNAGNVMLRLNKLQSNNAIPASTNSVQFTFTLSDTNFTTPRQQGYISFNVQQVSPNSVGTANNYMQFRVGPNDTNTFASAANGFLDLRFYNNAATKNIQILSPANGSLSATTNAISQTDPVAIKIWYNNLSSAMTYTNPVGASVTLNGNSLIVYANNTLLCTNSAWANGQPLTNSVTSGSGTSSTIGKIGFFITTGNGADFYIDNLYAADTAPAAASPPVITSPSTTNAYLGRTFSYQITGSNSPTSFNAVGLPAGLTNNPTTGQITGTPTGSLGTSAVTLTASNSAGTSSEFTLSITVNPTPVVTWNNTGSAWATSSCWTNGAAPVSDWSTDTAVFTGDYGNSNNAVTLVTGRQVSTILFNAGANAYTFDGGDITVGNGITNNSLNAQIFNSKVYGNSNRTWTTVAGGSLVFNGGVDITSAGSSANRTLTLGGGGNFTITGTIGNGGTATNGAITVSSTGLTLFSGANTYSGLTTVNANSTLKLGNALALGTTTNGTTISSGGVLDLNGQNVSGEALSLAGTGIGSGGALINSGSSDASWSGTVALVNSATYINASAGKKITLSGVVSGDLKGIYKMGPGPLELSGTNTFSGTNQVIDGAMILSGPNAATGYTLDGYATNISPRLQLTLSNALSASANLTGSSTLSRTGTLEFATAGDYILNQYLGNNINLTNSSGSASSLIFTNNNHAFSSGGGRTLANQSTNLSVTFLGQLDISGNANADCTISAIGPVVISNRIYNSNTNFTRGLSKTESGALTIYGTNNYNGSTTVSRGILSIPTGGSLANCGATVVRGSGTSSGNSASLNLAGAAGVVQVSTNGYVRGGGSITSLQVQDGGTVEVAVGSTWITGGSIDFAAGSKVSVTGTPTAGQNYTLMTAASAITGTPTLSAPIAGFDLVISGNSLLLKPASVSSGFDAWLSNYPSLTGDSAARTADPDGDGMSNQDEYAFGTDPTSAGSKRLTSVDTGTSGQVTLKWLQRDGVTYLVKSSIDLSAGFGDTETGASASSPQPSGLASGLTQYEITVSTTGTRKFIRVQATVP